MTQEEKNNIIKELKRLGFKPREDKDINNYIKQLNIRLGKQGKQLEINYIPNWELENITAHSALYKTNDYTINIEIINKPEKVVRTKKIFVRATEEENEKYKKLAENRHTDLSKLIRDLLDRECDNE